MQSENNVNLIQIGGIIITITTLFESQIILAEHECSTNWGDCKSNKSNQIKCWFLRRGENRRTRRKTSRSRVENQQTQSTYDAGSRNRTRDTLVEGERSHHCANPAPPMGEGGAFEAVTNIELLQHFKVGTYEGTSQCD